MPWGDHSSPVPDGSKHDEGSAGFGTSRIPLHMAASEAGSDRQSDRQSDDTPTTTTTTTTTTSSSSSSSSSSSTAAPRADSLKDRVKAYCRQPHNWIAPVAAAGLTLGIWTFYQTYLRRFPGTDHIAPGFFRRRSLLGKVTSVGDGDGFHMFHTPGGWLAGWGWLRRIPTDRKELKGHTVSPLSHTHARTHAYAN